MTDLMTRPESEDTGEIPLAEPDPGPDTRNLSGYAAGLPPVRRPDAVQALIADHTGVVPATYPTPDPLPPPPPPTPGRHRRRSRWDWLTVPLAMAVQYVRGEHRAAGR